MKKGPGMIFSAVFASWILAASVFGGSATLRWQPNTEPDLKEYRVYYGLSSRTYNSPIAVGNVTSYTMNGLEEGKTYYFCVTAVDNVNNESGYSQEVSKAIPAVTDTSSPSVSITSPTSASRYETSESPIRLAGTASDNSTLSRVTWASSRGGSGTASGTTSWVTSFITLAPGDNVITVTATDETGNTSSDRLTVAYQPTDVIEPAVTITSPTSNPSYQTSNSYIGLVGAASDNVNVVTVTWASSRGSSGTASGTTQWSVSRVPLVAGENLITVTATDAAGNQGHDVLSVVCSPSTAASPPVAAFAADSTLGVLPVSIQFTDVSTGAITSWSWNFGDGQTSTEKSPAHSYLSAGTYSVSLTVNGPGGSDTETKANYITVTQPTAQPPTQPPIQPPTTQPPTAVAASIGVFREGMWYLDLNGNGRWDGCEIDGCFQFGLPTDIPICGDWNGDGKTEIGCYRDGNWYLDSNGNRQWDEGTDLVIPSGSFGLPGETPIAGDWNGDGVTDIGIFKNGVWYLDSNGNHRWDPAEDNLISAGNFGEPTDIPITGDWNGDGKTKIGVFRKGAWYLDSNGSNQWDEGTDQTILSGDFGLPSDIPITGDWNGDGVTDIGTFREANWYLDAQGNRKWDEDTDITIPSGDFGLPTDIPVTGKWQ